MATTLEMLNTARTNLITAYTAATVNPQPNYSIDGETYAWSDYLEKLEARIAAIDKLIAREDADQLNFEIEIKGI